MTPPNQRAPGRKTPAGPTGPIVGALGALTAFALAIVCLSHGGVSLLRAGPAQPAGSGSRRATAAVLGERRFDDSRRVTLGRKTYRPVRAVYLRGGGARLALAIGPQVGSAGDISVVVPLVAWNLGPSPIRPLRCSITLSELNPPAGGAAHATFALLVPAGRMLLPQRILKIMAGFDLPGMPDNVTVDVTARVDYAVDPGGPEKTASGRSLLERRNGYWEWLQALGTAQDAVPPMRAQRTPRARGIAQE